MEKYESKQVRIERPAAMIYNTLSDFNNFTPIVADKLDKWEVQGHSCTFCVKGFEMTLHIVEKEPDKLVKIVSADGSPVDFTLWLQLIAISDNDTRMRVVLHTKLNMMLKMMIGNKLRDGLDQVVDRVAEAFNNMPQ